ncbi:hypothetical protein GBA52_015979 [Prunus armeniaca]|nr:hypothetical protein GBA52_015979 [Prunus armeniaca]
MGSFAARWRVLSGEDEWEGLLDPLDIDLRRYIIHYGERAGASGYGFIDKPTSISKNIGLPRYAKRNLFSKVGLETGQSIQVRGEEVFVCSNKICTWEIKHVGHLLRCRRMKEAKC